MSEKTEKHKGYRQVEQPEMVKVENVGDSVEGGFVAIEESKKFKDSYAVTFHDAKKDGALSCVFVSPQARDLFIRSKVKNAQNFILEFTGEKKAEESGET